MSGYQPVTIGDLITQDLALEAHCHECGRMVLLKPETLYRIGGPLLLLPVNEPED